MNYRILRRVLIMGFAFLLIIAMTACNGQPTTKNTSKSSGGDSKSVKWVDQALLPKGHMNADAEIFFAKEVEKRTNGRITFDVYTGGGLGIKDQEVLNAVGDGLMQSGTMYGSHVAGQLKITEIMELPFLIPYDIELRKKITDALLPYWKKELTEKFNAFPIAVMQVEARNVYTSKKVESLSDLAGLKIRVQGPVETQLTNGMGAVSTPVAFPEVYTALQQGVVDGYWVTNSATVSNKLYEVAKYVWEVGTGGATYFLMVNKDAFDALSEEDQKIVLEVGKEAEELAWNRVKSDDEKFKKQLEDMGVTFNKASDKDLAKIKEIAAPIIDRWIKDAGPKGKEMLDVINKILKEEGY